MTKSTVATLKIRPEIFELIRSGLKHYEVRAASLDGVNVICYLDSESGDFLGSYSVGGVEQVGRDHDVQTIERSGVSADTFYDLFPRLSDDGPSTLWVARIDKPVDLHVALGI